MKWQNQVQLIGYLGIDPYIKILPTGYYYAVLKLATNDDFSREGKKRITMWHRIIVWGKKPGYIQNCFMKGSHVLVDGQLSYRTYQDKEGQTRYVTEIRATKLMNLDR